VDVAQHKIKFKFLMMSTRQTDGAAATYKAKGGQGRTLAAVVEEHAENFREIRVSTAEDKSCGFTHTGGSEEYPLDVIGNVVM
jgi:hypothetical protein